MSAALKINQEPKPERPVCRDDGISTNQASGGSLDKFLSAFWPTRGLGYLFMSRTDFREIESNFGFFGSVPFGSKK